MKLKPKTIDPCNGSPPLQHYINTNKKYRKYKAVHLLPFHGLLMPLNKRTNPWH